MAEERIVKEQRYSAVYTENIQKDVSDRTCPVYTVSDNLTALQELANTKPENMSEINISWIDSALQQALFENKYSAWDLIEFPAGLWVASAYGNGISVVAGADGKIAIKNNDSQVWEEKAVIDDLSCVAYGDDRFIALSSTGQGIYSDDYGNTWQSLTVPVDNFSGLAYSNGNFIAISSTGKVYYSNDKGVDFNEVNTGITSNFTTIATDGMSKVIILGNSGNDRCLYSKDNGKSYKVINIAGNSWTSVVYGENKFIACSSDGTNRLARFNIDTEEWIYNNVANYEWRSLSYGARVFTCLAVTGEVISSTDGVRWLEVPAHTGDWNNILRTDYFFIAFSSADNPQGLNAMRSSNGGILGVDFATLDEVINNEFVQKAINPNVLREYLNYRTGKETGQYPVYEDNKFIDCISDKANSLNIIYIDDNSPITSLDEIIEDGYYFIGKEINNKPETVSGVFYLTVFTFKSEHQNNITQLIYVNQAQLGFSYYARILDYNTSSSFSNWILKKIQQSDIYNIDLSQDNISVSQTGTYSACNSLLMQDENNIIKAVDKEQIKLDNSQINGLGNLATKDTISTNEVAGLGALATKNKANLTSDVENILSVANGGTGDNNGRNLLINNYNLFNIIGFSGGTTYDFEEKLKKYRINNGNYNNIYILNNQGYNGLIKDLPLYQGLDLVSLNLGDNLWTSRMFAFGAGSYETYEYLKKVLATSGSWIKIRNNDGTIPAELGGRPNTYTTSAGTWTETYLSTGEIMLEGWGQADILERSNFSINFPKLIDTYKVQSVTVTWNVSLIADNTLPPYVRSEFSNYFNISNQNFANMRVNWIFKGILP